MAQYLTDFSEYTTGQQPNDWTSRISPADVSWQVYDDAGMTGGKYLRGVGTATSSKFLTWDVVDADANRDNVEVLIKFVYDGSKQDSELTAGTRVTGTAVADVSAWRNGARISLTPSLAQTRTFSNGTVIAGQEVQFDLINGETYWIRARENGDNHKLKIWNATNPEPAAWLIEQVSTDVNQLGSAGVFTFRLDTGKIDIVSIATNGETATHPQLATVVAPTVQTDPASVNSDDAILNGQWTADGGATVTEVGFYYSTTAGVTNADTRVVPATQGNPFSYALTALADGTYYFRAFAVNSVGESLGGEQSFTISTAASSITISVTGTDISITYPSGATLAEEKTAIDGNVNASALISVTTPGGAGANLITSQGITNLTGGKSFSASIAGGVGNFYSDILPQSGAISGIINDGSGNPVSGVKVYAIDQTNDSVQTGTTGVNGGYSITGLQDRLQSIFVYDEERASLTAGNVYTAKAEKFAGAKGNSITIAKTPL